MPNAVQYHPAAAFTPTAVDYVPITLGGANIDLTDPSGVTGGYCARSVQIGGTAGNLVVETVSSTGAAVTRTIPVAANAVVPVGVAKIYSAANGTTATPVGVYL